MRSYSNDPRQMPAKFASICPKCKKQIKKGQTIIYWPSTKSATCEACSDKDFKTFLASAQDEDFLQCL